MIWVKAYFYPIKNFIPFIYFFPFKIVRHNGYSCYYY